VNGVTDPNVWVDEHYQRVTDPNVWVDEHYQRGHRLERWR
jgi:hypothetical protein